VSRRDKFEEEIMKIRSSLEDALAKRKIFKAGKKSKIINTLSAREKRKEKDMVLTFGSSDEVMEELSTISPTNINQDSHYSTVDIPLRFTALPFALPPPPPATARSGDMRGGGYFGRFRPRTTDEHGGRFRSRNSSRVNNNNSNSNDGSCGRGNDAYDGVIIHGEDNRPWTARDASSNDVPSSFSSSSSSTPFSSFANNGTVMPSLIRLRSSVTFIDRNNRRNNNNNINSESSSDASHPPSLRTSRPRPPPVIPLLALPCDSRVVPLSVSARVHNTAHFAHVSETHERFAGSGGGGGGGGVCVVVVVYVWGSDFRGRRM
jgi:hypothetical protein